METARTDLSPGSHAPRGNVVPDAPRPLRRPSRIVAPRDVDRGRRGASKTAFPRGAWERGGVVALLVLIFSPIASAAEPELGRLKAHVETLASPAFAGRRGEGAKKTARYIEDNFRSIGLEPGFGESYSQPIPGQEPGQAIGRNVAAKLAGSDAALKDEWIVVAAHFDHLGRRGGVVYPGADDNASGVSAMLEIARLMAEPGSRPKRSMLFVGFDLEEDGLFGSRYFAERSPVELGKIALVVNFDMIGRSLLGVCDDIVFLLGTERIAGVRPWIEEANAGQALKVAMVGTDILGIDRSDYGPFRVRKVPYLFFSTGENPDYHRASDVAETILYPKFAMIARLIFGIVRRAADAPSVPKWSDVADYPPGEAASLRDVFRILLDHREALGIKGVTLVLMRNCLRTLDVIIARGSITPAERSGVLRVAQVVLFSIT